MNETFFRILDLIRIMNSDPEAKVSTPDIIRTAHSWHTSQRNVYRYIGETRQILQNMENVGIRIVFPKKGPP